MKPDKSYSVSDAMRSWRKHGVTLHMWELPWSGSTTHVRIHYRLMHGRKCVFEASDYKVPPHRGIDSNGAVVTLLSFLTLQPGDTDKEYFDDYTEEQREWMQSDACDMVKMYVYSVENKEYDE